MGVAENPDPETVTVAVSGRFVLGVTVIDCARAVALRPKKITAVATNPSGLRLLSLPVLPSTVVNLSRLSEGCQRLGPRRGGLAPLRPAEILSGDV